MHDVVFIEFFESINKLSKDDKRLVFRQTFLFLKHGFEGTSIAVLINKVEVVGCFECLYKSDDILIFERGEDIDLIDGKLF